MHTDFKVILDGISVGVVITTLLGWLPSIAAFLSIVWLLIQLYDRFNPKPKKGIYKVDSD